MGHYRGPNTSTDGLVFGYDTGVGLVDNNKGYRYYKGEPATNFINSNATWWGDGNNQTVGSKGYTIITDEDLKYKGYETVIWTPGESRNVYLHGSNDIPSTETSTVWTFTCYMRYEDNTPITSMGVYMYYPTGDGHSAGIITDCGDGWYRVSRTRTGSNDYINLAGFTSFEANKRVYLSGPMLTKTNQPVPYINRSITRSSTECLYDLTGNTPLDLSNISFNSDGQIKFPGNSSSDSRIYAPIQLADHFTDNQSLTIETIVNVISTGTSPNGRGGLFCNQKWLTENDPGGFGLGINSGKFNPIFTNGNIPSTIESIALIDINYGVLEFITYTYDSPNSTVKAYRNGVLESTSNSNTNWTLPSTHRNTIIGSNTQGGWGYHFEMEIPIIRLHNKALTETEVKQNYNALKGRFNLE